MRFHAYAIGAAPVIIPLVPVQIHSEIRIHSQIPKLMDTTNPIIDTVPLHGVALPGQDRLAVLRQTHLCSAQLFRVTRERRHRVLQSECELTFQVRDAFGLFGDLPFSLGELLTQSLNLTLQALLNLCTLLPLRPRHAQTVR